MPDLIITERFISFETAKLAKEAGFTWQETVITVFPNTVKPAIVSGIGCHDIGLKYPCYNDEGKPISPGKYNSKNVHYPRPTVHLFAEWLRERHDWHVEVSWDSDGDWVGRVQQISYDEEVVYATTVHTGLNQNYDKCVDECHQFILKNKIKK